MYIIEATIVFTTQSFTLCENEDTIMGHKSRAEQFDIDYRARKDPRKVAKRTKPHSPAKAYKREHYTLSKLFDTDVGESA